MCFGIPIGSEAFITHKLQEQAQEIIADAEKAREMLSSNYQSLWTALRLSISTRFQYWMQLTPPSLCEPVARGLDNALWTILEAACGFKVPRGGEEGGLELRIPEIPNLDHTSFQEWAIRLPARLHGWGFRSLADLPTLPPLKQLYLSWLEKMAFVPSCPPCGEEKNVGERELQLKQGGGRSWHQTAAWPAR